MTRVGSRHRPVTTNPPQVEKAASAAGGKRALGHERQRGLESREHRCSFDHLVGAGEEGWGDREAERRGDLSIDDQLEARRLLDGQIRRSRTLENLINEHHRSAGAHCSPHSFRPGKERAHSLLGNGHA